MSLILNQVMIVKNGEKKHFYDLSLAISFDNDVPRDVSRKLYLSCTCFNSSEGQESCDFLAKNNFMRTAFWKFGAECDCIRKNAKASRNCCIKSKQSCKHGIYNESWFNNKTEKVWHLFVCWCFIQLSLFAFPMLILMGSKSIMHATLWFY